MSEDRLGSDASKSAASKSAPSKSAASESAQSKSAPPAAGQANVDQDKSGSIRPAQASTAAPRHLFAREALGFWFLGLGLLGLVRSWMRATRHGAFDADAITLLWLIGSALLTIMGALRIWRSLRPRPPKR